MTVFPDDFTLAVDKSKIIHYLLSMTHPTGRHKARFFRHLGFSRGRAEFLRQALLQHGLSQPCRRIERTEFGVKYIVEGVLIAPGTRTGHFRTVWFVEKNSRLARLVTAYPMGAKNDS